MSLGCSDSEIQVYDSEVQVYDSLPSCDVSSQVKQQIATLNVFKEK